MRRQCFAYAPKKPNDGIVHVIFWLIAHYVRHRSRCVADVPMQWIQHGHLSSLLECLLLKHKHLVCANSYKARRVEPHTRITPSPAVRLTQSKANVMVRPISRELCGPSINPSRP